jgi:hypothetical protein
MKNITIIFSSLCFLFTAILSYAGGLQVPPTEYYQLRNKLDDIHSDLRNSSSNSDYEEKYYKLRSLRERQELGIRAGQGFKVMGKAAWKGIKKITDLFRNDNDNDYFAENELQRSYVDGNLLILQDSDSVTIGEKGKWAICCSWEYWQDGKNKGFLQDMKDGNITAFKTKNGLLVMVNDTWTVFYDWNFLAYLYKNNKPKGFSY